MHSALVLRLTPFPRASERARVHVERQEPTRNMIYTVWAPHRGSFKIITSATGHHFCVSKRESSRASRATRRRVIKRAFFPFFSRNVGLIRAERTAGAAVMNVARGRAIVRRMSGRVVKGDSRRVRRYNMSRTTCGDANAKQLIVRFFTAKEGGAILLSPPFPQCRSAISTSMRVVARTDG